MSISNNIVSIIIMKATISSPGKNAVYRTKGLYLNALPFTYFGLNIESEMTSLQ